LFVAFAPVGCRVDDDGAAAVPVAGPSSGIDPDIQDPASPPTGLDARADQAIAQNASVDAASVDAEGPAPIGGATGASDAGSGVSADVEGVPPGVAPPAAVPDAGPVDVVPPAPAVPDRCSMQRSLPVSARRIPGAPTSDDITFDRDGHLISFDRRGVVRVLSDGTLEPLSRDVIGQRGGALRAMPNGDVLLGDFERDVVIVRGISGQLRTLPTPVVAPMKMVRGPGGTVYVSGKQGTVYRIDADTGAVSAAVTTQLSLGGLTFSLDYKTLYLAATDTDIIYAFAVATDGSLSGQRTWRPLADVSALATDECGSVYALSENDGRVRRLRDGSGVEVVGDVSPRVPWSLAFGSGKQGWSATALYLLDASSGPLYELPVGVGDQPAPPDGVN
jgi:hypothetical protein